VGARRTHETWSEYDRRQEDAPAVWPYGLAFHLVLAAGSLAVTARRLRTPAGPMPRGVRVA
jgi:ABC-2 type transport system permease protein